MKLSVVISLLNEEDNIAPLLHQIKNGLSGFEYEVILVDDGSVDSTLNKILECADERIRTIVFRKNFGQTAALSAGISNATGDYIVTMDGDLQNDPADIPRMRDKLELEDLDIVMGYRQNRKDHVLVRKVPSYLANVIIRRLTGISIRDYGCTLKIFKKEIAKELDLYGELHRFIPVLAGLQGAKIAEINVAHRPRTHGKSKYGIGRTFRVISDLILMLFMQTYFRKPIHLFGPLGIICLAGGIAINAYLLTVKLMGEDIWGRPILILGALLLLAGIQFIIFGLLAELIMRVYYGSQNKKTYHIRKIIEGRAKE